MRQSSGQIHKAHNPGVRIKSSSAAARVSASHRIAVQTNILIDQHKRVAEVSHAHGPLRSRYTTLLLRRLRFGRDGVCGTAIRGLRLFVPCYPRLTMTIARDDEES